MYGMCTGTVPSGVALVRIIDPNFRTSTAVELGACNLVMMACTPVYIIVLALAAGSMSMPVAMGGLVACCVVYLIVLKVTKTWGKSTYSWK
jgi:ESS family glutamate:Na+ symporter